MSTPGKTPKPASPKPLPRSSKVIRSTADFARYVGLARTTVSRVLNGHPGLKSQTVERVQRAIEETGFTPNAYALHLKGKRTATIGICMENLLTAPAVLKLASLQRRLRERSHTSLIEVLPPGGSREVIRHFMSMRVDAVVFIGHFIEEEIARRVHELATHDTPHLVIDQLGIPETDTVALDRVRGMRDVMAHLLDLGHTYFGLLAINGMTRSVRDRLAGIEAELTARGLKFAESTLSLDHLHVRENDFKYGRALALSFVEEKQRPTAYVSLNDEVAIGAMHGFQAAGLRVPQDVSVAGFNNQDICLMPTPMLTTVDQQVQQTVDTAVDLLLAQIGHPRKPHPLVHMISPALVARDSTGPAPKKRLGREALRGYGLGVRIGALELSSPLFLSPLAGYTNLPMRLTVRELGGLGWATTDLINARSLLERNPTALKLAETCPGDRPLAIQLFGSVPEEMRDAAVLCQELGAQAVDINMGCPVRKVTQVGGGSAMMTELDKTSRLVAGMVAAVKIPVTAKMRLGWDDENLTAPDLARALEGAGVAAVFVHGRTRAQGFSGTVKLAGIRAVAEAVRSIPVIGNGDVTTPEGARHMLEATGCAGIGIGRGAFYDPWIFRRTERHLRTGEPQPEPDFAERLRVLRRHFERYVEFYGEERGARLFRKVAPWYAKRFGPAKPFKQAVIAISSRADFERVLAEYLAWRAPFCDERGELLPKYQPAPLVPSFLRPDGAPEPDGIPVPKGPVEVW